jgi:hypothetical protein
MSTPQYIYDSKQRLVGQVRVDEDGNFYIRRATLKHNDWSLWYDVDLSAKNVAAQQAQEL